MGDTSGLFDEVRMCCTNREVIVIGHAKVCFGPTEFAFCGEILIQDVQIIGQSINIHQISDIKECV